MVVEVFVPVIDVNKRTYMQPISRLLVRQQACYKLVNQISKPLTFFVHFLERFFVRFLQMCQISRPCCIDSFFFMCALICMFPSVVIECIPTSSKSTLACCKHTKKPSFSAETADLHLAVSKVALCVTLPDP